MLYKEHTSCRLCAEPLKTILDLGTMYLSTFTKNVDNLPDQVPMVLTECEGCGLIQLKHTVDSDFMYSEYWYQSGLNKSMVNALRDVTRSVEKYIQLNDIVVDIGANDGTLLRQYTGDVQDKAELVAFEPCDLADKAIDACDTLFPTYFAAAPYLTQYKPNSAKVITSIAMFYDVEKPHVFIDDIKTVMTQDGVWVVQMMDLVSMLQTSDFANMCHEHVIYYTLRDLVNILKPHGMEVFDVEYNKVNGSSVRAYICNKGEHQIMPRVSKALKAEDDYLTDRDEVFSRFSEYVQTVKQSLRRFVDEVKSAGQTIAVFGASTKGNTILQYCGLTSDDIDHAAEVNPDKFGLYTVGTNIPIIDQKESLAKSPDFYLVLPWGFIDNFIDNHQDYLKSGGKFVVPLPIPSVITYDDEAGIQLWSIL